MGITKTNKNDRYILGYMNNNNIAMQAIIMVLKLVFSLCMKCCFAFDFAGKEGHVLFEIHPGRQHWVVNTLQLESQGTACERARVECNSKKFHNYII